MTRASDATTSSTPRIHKTLPFLPPSDLTSLAVMISFYKQCKGGGNLTDIKVSLSAKSAQEALASNYVQIGCRLPLHCHILETAGASLSLDFLY